MGSLNLQFNLYRLFKNNTLKRKEQKKDEGKGQETQGEEGKEEEWEEEDTWQVDQVSGREPRVVPEAAAIMISGPHPMA